MKNSIVSPALVGSLLLCTITPEHVSSTQQLQRTTSDNLIHNFKTLSTSSTPDYKNDSTIIVYPHTVKDSLSHQSRDHHLADQQNSSITSSSTTKTTTPTGVSHQTLEDSSSAVEYESTTLSSGPSSANNTLPKELTNSTTIISAPEHNNTLSTIELEQMKQSHLKSILKNFHIHHRLIKFDINVLRNHIYFLLEESTELHQQGDRYIISCKSPSKVDPSIINNHIIAIQNHIKSKNKVAAPFLSSSKMKQQLESFSKDIFPLLKNKSIIYQGDEEQLKKEMMSIFDLYKPEEKE